ncbi:hypothetical protein LINPERPRIM_LOCUS37242 [Linum perenne]
MGMSVRQVRELVRYVCSSPSRAAAFKECVIFKHIFMHKVVATRWNSTYLMLESSEPYEEAFKSLEVDDIHFVPGLHEKVYVNEVFGPPNHEDWVNEELSAMFMVYQAKHALATSSSHQTIASLWSTSGSAMRTTLERATSGIAHSVDYLDDYLVDINVSTQLKNDLDIDLELLALQIWTPMQKRTKQLQKQETKMASIVKMMKIS